jgi:hypothetical protein
VVYLSVVIEDLEPDAPPAGITGDGQPYDHGAADGTTASLDRYGNLIVSFGRPVTFDYSDLLEGLGGAPSGSYDGSYISTVPQQAGDGALQNLAENASQCIQLNWQFRDAANVLWRNGFHRDRDLPDQGGTSYAVVTRTTPESWEVEPLPGWCGGYLNPDRVASVWTHLMAKGKNVYTDYGKYRLPFRLTLTQLQ